MKTLQSQPSVNKGFTIVAYNGVQTRAQTATILSDLNDSVMTLELANVTGGV
jgi:hypothetical protein